MQLKVEVTGASLSDVVGVLINEYDEQTGTVTLGDLVARQVAKRLEDDVRWPALMENFYAAVYAEMRKKVPELVEGMVAAEVKRQFELGQGATTRGAASSRVEAMISTEVTTQLRAEFGPLVKRALDNLARDLRALSGDAVETFMKGSGRKDG